MTASGEDLERSVVRQANAPRDRDERVLERRRVLYRIRRDSFLLERRVRAAGKTGAA